MTLCPKYVSATPARPGPRYSNDEIEWVSAGFSWGLFGGRFAFAYHAAPPPCWGAAQDPATALGHYNWLFAYQNEGKTPHRVDGGIKCGRVHIPVRLEPIRPKGELVVLSWSATAAKNH